MTEGKCRTHARPAYLHPAAGNLVNECWARILTILPKALRAFPPRIPHPPEDEANCCGIPLPQIVHSSPS